MLLSLNRVFVMVVLMMSLCILVMVLKRNRIVVRIDLVSMI